MTELIEVRTEIAQWVHANEAAFDLLMGAIVGNRQIAQAPAPAVRGAIGEDRVLAILAPHYRVRNVAHDSKVGDLTLLVEDLKIMIEVKNYTTTVGKPNVEKFERDLTTSVPDAALFISLNTPIGGITDSFRIMYHKGTNSTIPCIYVVRPIEAQIVSCVEMLRGLARSSQIVREASQTAIDESTAPLLDTVESLSKLRDSMLVFASSAAATTLKHSNGISAVEQTIRDRLKSLRMMAAGCGKLTEHERWKSYSPEDQANLTGFVNAVEERYPQGLGEPGWFFGGRDASHPSGYSIKFLASPKINAPINCDLSKYITHLVTKKLNIINGRVETTPEYYTLLF